MRTRPLSRNEYMKIMELCKIGFTDTKGSYRRPNYKVAFALMLQANLGLRIGDVLNLKPSNFNNLKFTLVESKTKKFQYRQINEKLYLMIMDYIVQNEIKQADVLIPLTSRAIQKHLKYITDYLQMDNISTHSFRKMFATTIYTETSDIYLVKELLNHSSVATTERYVRMSQEQIDEMCKNIDFVC